MDKLHSKLANRYKHSLLCGYSLHNLLHEAGVAGFRRVCDHHTGARLLDDLQQNIA